MVIPGDQQVERISSRTHRSNTKRAEKRHPSSASSDAERESELVACLQEYENKGTPMEA